MVVFEIKDIYIEDEDELVMTNIQANDLYKRDYRVQIQLVHEGGGCMKELNDDIEHNLAIQCKT